MTYELCKELKEVGFPQKGTWEDHEGLQYWSVYDGGASKQKPEIIAGREANFGFMEDLCYIPTLSELISACGEDFSSLTKREKFWDAHTYKDTYAIHAGSTPEEAVARLWLLLNKK